MTDNFSHSAGPPRRRLAHVNGRTTTAIRMSAIVSSQKHASHFVHRIAVILLQHRLVRNHLCRLGRRLFEQLGTEALEH